MPEPIMRRPTRWERIVFRVLRRWPDSYVDARLRWWCGHEDYCRRRMLQVGSAQLLREMRAARDA